MYDIRSPDTVVLAPAELWRTYSGPTADVVVAAWARRTDMLGCDVRPSTDQRLDLARLDEQRV